MKRGGLVTVFLMLTWILTELKLIPLTGVASPQGMAVFALSYEFMFVLSILSSYFIPDFVAGKISLRQSRGQQRNIRRVLLASLLAAFLLGLLLSLLFFLGAGRYASGFAGVPDAAFAMKILSAAILIYAVTGVFKGYFEGLGTMMPTCVTGLFEQLIVLPVSLLVTYRLHTYGQKVADLLQQPITVAAYSGAAVCFSVMICGLLSLLFLLIVYFVYRHTMHEHVGRDSTKMQDSISGVMMEFYHAVFPYVCPVLFLFADAWINQRLYFHAVLPTKTADSVLTSYGVYYGHYRALVLMLTAVLVAACHFLTPVVAKLFGREAYHQLQMEFYSDIRRILAAGGVLSLLLTLLSSVVAGMLFKQNTALSAKLFLVGSFAILCYALAIYSTAFVRGLKMPWISAGVWFLCLLVQSLLTYLLVHKTSLDITALAVMNVLYPLLVFGVNFLMIRTKLSD